MALHPRAASDGSWFPGKYGFMEEEVIQQYFSSFQLLIHWSIKNCTLEIIQEGYFFTVQLTLARIDLYLQTNQH